MTSFNGVSTMQANTYPAFYRMCPCVGSKNSRYNLWKPSSNHEFDSSFWHFFPFGFFLFPPRTFCYSNTSSPHHAQYFEHFEFFHNALIDTRTTIPTLLIAFSPPRARRRLHNHNSGLLQTPFSAPTVFFLLGKPQYHVRISDW